MAPHPQYGAISNTNDDDVEVELHGRSPTTTNAGDSYIGNISYTNDHCCNGNHNHNSNNNNIDATQSSNKTWTRHHYISYSIAAVICLFSAHYWHARAESYGGNNGTASSNNNNNNNSVKSDSSIVIANKNASFQNRVPMPPALSTLDPSADLGFRSTKRKGLAAPSLAWGAHFLNGGDGGVDDEEDGRRRLLEDEGGAGFTALPTNAWYMNLLSHKAAKDPSAAGEIAHVYTIPYVLGVSPPKPEPIPDAAHTKDNAKTTTTMAGIELFLPVLKTSERNMQMVFDKNNGVSLGAMVVSEDNTKNSIGDDALTAYEVDPDEAISPLGVSLRWKHVNIKTHVVRGMPYGTMRFGKDQHKKPVLPTITSGNRPVSILLDSDVIDPDADDSSVSSSNQMLCGSLTGKPIIQDPNHAAPISSDGKAHAYEVKREIVFHLAQSDFTWVAFFSKPVSVKCYSDAYPMFSTPGAIAESQFRLDVTEISSSDGGEDDGEELVVRVALFDECTTGKSIIKEHCDNLASLGYETISSKGKSEKYLKVLRKGADLYSKSPMVGTQFPEDDDDGEDRVTNVVFDWDVTSVDSGSVDVSKEDIAVSVAASSLRAATKAVTNAASAKTTQKSHPEDFIMFALPHHLETFAATTPEIDNESIDSALCVHTFHGRTCLVHGSKWNLPVEHGKPQSFLADRPPLDTAIPALADALNTDIKFQISPNVLRGAADTYFPAKVLAKVGRIIEINQELKNLQSGENYNYSDADESTIEASASAAAEVTLPSEEEVESLLDDLQLAVEIWLKPGGKENGGGEAEFIYDETWGGFINCGCSYTFKKGKEDSGTCSNVFPDCPALKSVNEDFGNGWYNDHHFHYGYHVYAAAVVAKHRPEWGRENFESVLLYIRDIANPSAEDEYFPMWRQKDWYLGNSWAAGLMSAELSPHGREQESSSEAIAAFEGIALFGGAMMDAFVGDDKNLGSARLVRNLGEFLTSMEVQATNRFWHLWNSNSTSVSSENEDVAPRSLHVNDYPSGYQKPVVGMMHETMASFQTWFAPQDVVSYGIQLMPLTAIAERRDDPEWSKLLYPIYADACERANEGSDGFCEDNGWSILQAGVLAETGKINDALEFASDIPDEVFVSQGACGNSYSNTIWFISTRKLSDGSV